MVSRVAASVSSLDHRDMGIMDHVRMWVSMWRGDRAPSIQAFFISLPGAGNAEPSVIKAG
jgi:hypothetical protein